MTPKAILAKARETNTHGVLLGRSGTLEIRRYTMGGTAHDVIAPRHKHVIVQPQPSPQPPQHHDTETRRVLGFLLKE